MKSLLLLISIFGFSFAFGQDKILINEDLFLVKLSDKTYIHTSYFESPEWGRFPSNGLVILDEGNGILIDTPMSDELTISLINWMEDSMKVKIIAFVPNHWHSDCTEGMDILMGKNIPTYGYILTHQLLNSKKLPETQYSFSDSLSFQLGNQQVICSYPGEAHTSDNIVVWLPAEKILFGGCMVKSGNSSTLGNTADANLEEWPETLKKVLARYPDAKIVVPGHGPHGDLSLIQHTLTLFE